jgi:NitT/TauT family transport system permease protein
MTAATSQPSRPAATAPGARRARPRHLSPGKRWALRLTSVAVLLAAWEIYGRLLNPILLSRPSAVAAASVAMIRDGSLPQALGASLVVLGLGLLSGVVVGVVLGLIAGRSESVAALFEFPVSALYATPAVALIPIIVLWFGFEVTAKTVVVFLFVVFPVLINTMRGVQEVDPELTEVARTFCSSERRMWRDLILPSALPYIVTGIRLAIGRALIGVIVAEYYTALSGLGHLIATNANSFQTARMFVPIVVIALLGVILTALLQWAERHLAQWRKTP